MNTSNQQQSLKMHDIQLIEFKGEINTFTAIATALPISLPRKARDLLEM